MCRVVTEINARSNENRTKDEVHARRAFGRGTDYLAGADAALRADPGKAHRRNLQHRVARRQPDSDGVTTMARVLSSGIASVDQ